jgi:Tol biopolymer transport system component
VTVTAPPRPPRRPSDPVDREEVEALVEALIEEARQRARRRRRMYGAVVALVALVGVALGMVFERTAQSQSASPALSARSSLAAATASSKIAFMTAVPKTLLPKGVQFQSEVNVMNADGSGKQRLARIAWNFQAPVWSPDGQKLAFERRLDPTKYKGQCGSCDVEVYVMNADGSAQQNLTRNVAYDGDPAWSPDGQKIAFVTNRDGKPGGQFAPESDIHVMNADGSGQQNLTRNPAGEGNPVWSPDGQQIAFERVVGGVGNRNFEIYVMNADGSDQRRLTSNPAFDGSPVWSPDGQRIAYTSDRDQRRYRDDVYVMNADGSGQKRLTRNPAQDSWPVWSPDGQRIAFTRVRNTPERRDRNSEVYVMNADGSGLRNLTRTPASDGHPVWSPDGRKIGFVSNRGGNRDIYVVNADGSGPRNLTRDVRRQAFGLAWSPARKK